MIYLQQQQNGQAKAEHRASCDESSAPSAAAKSSTPAAASAASPPLFSKSTKALVWGMQSRAVQGMLGFDYSCSRTTPSVVALVYPLVGDHRLKFYWGHKEVLIPVYKQMEDAMKAHPDADVLVSFASLRSAYDSTLEAMQYKQVCHLSQAFDPVVTPC
jgi:ATP citrate (pro-S)-lyase